MGDGRDRRPAVHRIVAPPHPGTRPYGSQPGPPAPAGGATWHVAGRMLGAESLKGLRRLMLAVAGEDMREQPKVAPLQFVLSEGNQYITSYRVSEKPVPEAMSVVFVIPRTREAAASAFFEGVLSCLRWKRPSD